MHKERFVCSLRVEGKQRRMYNKAAAAAPHTRARLLFDTANQKNSLNNFIDHLQQDNEFQSINVFLSYSPIFSLRRGFFQIVLIYTTIESFEGKIKKKLWKKFNLIPLLVLTLMYLAIRFPTLHLKWYADFNSKFICNPTNFDIWRYAYRCSNVCSVFKSPFYRTTNIQTVRGSFFKLFTKMYRKGP